MKTATIEDLLDWGPLQDEDVVRQMAGDTSEFTAVEVLRREDVTAEDRLWVVLRPEMIDEHTLHVFACDCAEHVLPIYERAHPDDERPRRAIETKRAWLAGKATAEELAAARDAAWAAWAAWDATWATRDAAWAARDAAWATRDAARAARAATWAAAWDAAWDAWDAAWDAETAWQIAHLISLLD